MSILFGVLSSIMFVMAVMMYIATIIRDGMRPQRVTWFVLAFISWTLVVSGYAENGDVTTTVGVMIVLAVSQSVIFLLAINRGEGGTTRRDIACIMISGLGIVLWQMSGMPLIALIGAIIADGAALWPTIKSAWLPPAKEARLPWTITVVGAGCAILAVDPWTVGNTIFPAYLFLADTTIVVGLWMPELRARVRC